MASQRKHFNFHSDEEIIESLLKHKGVVSVSARAIDMTPQGLRKRIKDNPKLREVMYEARENYKDELEAAIMEKTVGNKPETVMQIFAAKCLLRDRGWVENPPQENKAPDVKIAIVNYADGTTQVSVDGQKKEVISADASSALPKRDTE